MTIGGRRLPHFVCKLSVNAASGISIIPSNAFANAHKMGNNKGIT